MSEMVMNLIIINLCILRKFHIVCFGLNTNRENISISLVIFIFSVVITLSTKKMKIGKVEKFEKQLIERKK